MINPISPQFVYLIHKDKEREMLRNIEQARIAKEVAALRRAEAEASASLGQSRAWYAQAFQSIKGKLFQRAGSQPETLNEPCPTAPC